MRFEFGQIYDVNTAKFTRSDSFWLMIWSILAQRGSEKPGTTSKYLFPGPGRYSLSPRT